jgi:hypothetical protein
VTDPAERERLFGQWDHVRVYGRDYAQRLADAGFDVQVISYAGGSARTRCLRAGWMPPRASISVASRPEALIPAVAGARAAGGDGHSFSRSPDRISASRNEPKTMFSPSTALVVETNAR